MAQFEVSQIIILIFQCILVLGLLLSLFHLRKVMGIGLLFASLGVFQYIQVFLASTLQVEVFPEIIISPGSSVLFSSGLFMVLLIYIKEDARVVRTLIYALVAANLVLTILLFIFGSNIEGAGVHNIYNLPKEVFLVNARIFFVGTISLFIDAIAIILLFEYFSKLSSSIFVRVFATMSLVLALDALLFSFGAFIGTELFQQKFVNGLISKLFVALIYSLILTWYLYRFEKRESIDKASSFKDVFYFLTYRQKYEQVRIEREKEQLIAKKALEEYAQKLEGLVKLRTIALEEANQELESFSYSVSHDLRAPLTRLDGFSRILQTKYADRLDEKGLHYLDRIRVASQSMATLIDDLLSLSKITRQEIIKETVNLSDLAAFIMEELQETEPKRQLKLCIEPNLKASMDFGLATIMLENLLQNAWKFTSKKNLTRIEVGTVEKENGRWFFIKDNGIGFDMKYYHQLFDAFQRLHPSTDFKGTGIGLATVRRIIRKHGGQITAEGAPEKGATFYFKI